MTKSASAKAAKRVVVYGGSGFVGRYIVQRLARLGYRVRVAVRRPNEAMHVKVYGTPGQVEPVFCNIRDDASVRAAMDGVDAVVNCVGILAENSRQKFETVQHEGAARIARLARDNGISRLVHLSAIGADRESDSAYQRSKAAGEAAILDHMPGAVILRPSVIFGPEDGFFNKFAAMSRFGPILPLLSGGTQFQPVYVDDVAKAAVMGIEGEAAPGIYELGGPEVKSFRNWMEDMLAVVQRRRMIVNLPGVIGWVMATVLDAAQAVTLGLFKNSVITRDQLRSLRADSVVPEGAQGFAELGIEPMTAETILPDYLWRFRPSGQYDAIKNSAKNLSS